MEHHAEETGKSTTATALSTSGEDDFFNTWNQPKKAASPTTSGASSMAPPVVGLGASLNRSGSIASTSSSTLTAARPAKSTLTSARKTGTASKPMKLGAKKTGTISFEEAEARARAEADRIEKLGFEAAEEERLQKLANEQAKADAIKSAALGGSSSSGSGDNTGARSNYYQANTANKSRVSSEDMERLGMGMGRMDFGTAPAKASSGMQSRSGFGGMGGYSPQVEGTLDEEQRYEIIDM